MGILHEEGSITGQERNVTRRISRLKVTLVVVLAAVALAAFVMFGPPGETLESPEFCAGCHIMRTQYDAWVVSAHSDLLCVDCHLPPKEQFVRHWFWKGVTGMRDVWEFNTNQIPERIEASQETREWLAENCVRCHGELTAHMTVNRDCWECHRILYHRVQLRAVSSEEENHDG